MNYTCFVEINLPLETVVKLWQDENNYKKWQDGFVSIEHLEGTPDTKGAKSRIMLKQGKRKIELIETIISSNLPSEKKALYEHIHMTNFQTTRFEKIGEIRTRYISEVSYTKFNGFMPKMMALIFPKMFKNQNQKWMNQFKEYAESKTN